MRHRVKTVKLGRTGAHRDALLSGLVCNLIKSRRIKTTLPKAKATRSLAEKMVTLGKKNTLAARRRAISKLHQKDLVAVLFDEIAPGFKNRAGGYTRILKIGKRSSDGAEMALLEWVENDEQADAKPKPKKKKPDTAKKAPAKADKAESEPKEPAAEPEAEEGGPAEEEGAKAAAAAADEAGEPAGETVAEEAAEEPEADTGEEETKPEKS